MKNGKGQSQPEIVAAAFLILYMVLGSPFVYQVLIVTQVAFWAACVELESQFRFGATWHALESASQMVGMFGGILVWWDPFLKAHSLGSWT